MKLKTFSLDKALSSQEVIDSDLQKIFAEWKDQASGNQILQWIKNINRDWYLSQFIQIEKDDIPNVDSGLIWTALNQVGERTAKVLVNIKGFRFVADIKINSKGDDPPPDFNYLDLIERIKESHPFKKKKEITWNFKGKMKVIPRDSNYFELFKTHTTLSTTDVEYQLFSNIKQAIDFRNKTILLTYKSNTYQNELEESAEAHRDIVNKIRSLKYPLTTSGACNGISHMWLQSFLVGDEYKFNERVKLILSFENSKALLDKIAEVKDKIKIGLPISESEQNLFEIQSFLEGVFIYQDKIAHKGLFEREYGQVATSEISSVISSTALQKKKGIVEVGKKSGIYNYQEAVAFFDQLRDKLLSLPDSDKSLGMTLYCYNHTIGLRFDSSKNKWIMLDANQLPIKEIESDLIAANVLHAFKEYDYSAFSVRFFTTGDNEHLEKYQQSLNTFDHNITIDSANRKTDAGVTAAHMAASIGDLQTLDKLAKSGADLNVQQERRGTPAYFAAEEGQIESIKFLAKNGVDLNNTAKNGRTLVHIAADMNNVELLETLVDLKVKLNEDSDMTEFSSALKGSTFSGYTPAHLAAKKGNIEILKILARNNVPLDLPGGLTFKTPSHLAIEENQTAVIIELAKHGVNFCIEDTSGNSPLSIAIEKKSWDAVVLMLATIKNKDQIKSSVLEELNYHRSDLVKHFIQLIKKTDKSEATIIVNQVLNKKNALGILLSAPPPQQKRKLFGFFEFKTSQTNELKQINDEFKSLLTLSKKTKVM